jgi:hypothetical protein
MHVYSTLQYTCTYYLCPQWDTTGAISLIADDAYWNAMLGHLITPVAAGRAAVYRARPDFTPPVALDLEIGKLAS